MKVRLLILFNILFFLVNSFAPMDLACAFEGPEVSQLERLSVEGEPEADDCCDDEETCNFCSVCHPSMALIQFYSSELSAAMSRNFSQSKSIQSLFDPSGPEEPPRRSIIS